MTHLRALLSCSLAAAALAAAPAHAQAPDVAAAAEATPAPAPGGGTPAAMDSQPLGAPSDSPARNNPYSPVVTPKPGDFGLSFTLGGFGTFNLGPVSQSSAGGTGIGATPTVLVTEIGARAVLNPVVLTFSAGLGLNKFGDSTNFGLGASLGVLRGFRAWRRIAPYFGGQLRLTYLDPSGTDNYFVSIALGPVLGIEYFIFDRVSLNAQGALLFGANITAGGTQFALSTVLQPGGSLGMNVYF